MSSLAAVILIASIWAPVPSSAVWPELAELTSAALGHTCKKTPPAAPDSGEPDKILKENVAFRQLSKMRADDLQCGSQMASELTQNSQLWERGSGQILNSVHEIAEGTRSLLALYQKQEKQIPGPASQLAAPTISRLAAQDQRQQIMEFIKASYASIPFADHPEMRKVIASAVDQLTDSARQNFKRDKAVEFDENSDPLDSSELRTQIKSALAKISAEYGANKKTLDQQVGNPKHRFITSDREALAQDTALLERWRRQSNITDEQICRINNRYGDGAGRLDNALMGVTVVGTLATGPLASTARAGGALVLGATRVASARGLISSSAARVLGTVTQAGALAGLVRTYEANCTNQITKMADAQGPGQCSEFNVASYLNAGCAASVVFAGLYGRAVAPTVKDLMARSLRRRGYSPAMQTLQPGITAEVSAAAH